MNEDVLMTYTLPAFAVAIIAEALVSWRGGKHWYKPQDTGLSVGLLLLSAIIDLLPKFAALYCFLLIYAASPFKEVK